MGVTGHRGVDRPVLDRGEGRENLKVSAGGEVGHALEYAHLRKEARLVPRHRCPDLILLIFAPDLAYDLKTPPMGLVPSPAGVPQALEGDRHLRGETVLHDLATGLEQRVPRAIRSRNRATAMATPRGDDAVALYPVRIDVEAVPPLLVHEGVEVDREEVVHRRPVAVYTIGPHDRGFLIMSIKTEVDFFRVVRDIDLSLLGRGRTIEGRLLHELGKQSCRFPDFFVQAAVDHRRRVDAGGPHRGSPGDQT